MAVYSTNQVRQLYVAKAVKDSKVVNSDAEGTIRAASNGDHLYFEYRGADNLMRSDLIAIDHIISAKATKAADLKRAVKDVYVTLNSDVNGGIPVSGQDYLLRIAIRQYIGISDEDMYFKYGTVHAYAGMTASKFYVQLALSLAKNFSRELSKLIDFYLVEGDNLSQITAVNPLDKADAFTGTYTGILLREAEQEWTRGIKEQVPVYFDAYPTTIMVDGDEVIWGTAEEKAPTKFYGDGKRIADLEYFCAGERGDQYRNINWPNSIPTKYLVDASKDYHVLDIHYAYTGANESVQKSEKDITIVAENGTELDKLITAITTATGIDIDKING